MQRIFLIFSIIVKNMLDVEELQQLTEGTMQQGLFEPLNLSANYTMNGTETIVSSGIILDFSGFQALEEEGEVSAANITTTTTNGTDSDATAVTTIPISPAETGQENVTTITTSTTEEEQ
jgi:hypothetical protein